MKVVIVDVHTSYCDGGNPIGDRLSQSKGNR